MLICALSLLIIFNFLNTYLNSHTTGVVQSIHMPKITNKTPKLTRIYLYRLISLSGDIEPNPGPFQSYEAILKIIKKHDKHLKFLHINAQSLIRKRMQLKNLMHDIGSNTIFAISETWLCENDDTLVWNVLSDTHIVQK